MVKASVLFVDPVKIDEQGSAGGRTCATGRTFVDLFCDGLGQSRLLWTLRPAHDG